jgi:parallel beta-helix repeat protein
VDVVAEPKTHVVDAQGGGQFTTVGAAIKAASPQDRILVRPGLYQESLLIDQPLQIVGDGPRAQIEIRALDADVLVSHAPGGWVANLTFTQCKSEHTLGVDIRQGQLVIEECEILSQAGSCVYIRNNSDPVLRRNTIYGATKHGVLVYDGGRGTIEENEITGCSDSCVAVRSGGDPVVRRNTIRDGKDCGVWVHKDGRGTFEDNEISGNRMAGVYISSGGNATFRRNRINRNAWHGVDIYDTGGGTFEDNDLTGNSRGAWFFDDKADKSRVTRLRNNPL